MHWKQQLRDISKLHDALQELYPVPEDVMLNAMAPFIEAEVIEKLIVDALHLHNRHPLDAEQQLRAKWLT